MRDEAQQAFRAGVVAADPGEAVRRSIKMGPDGPGFLVHATAEHGFRTRYWTSIHVLAFGKAAVSMAEAARDVLPASLLRRPPLVVTSYENVCEKTGLEILGASHPLPNANGVTAAARVMEYAREAGAGELLLVLISGGGSALLPSPPAVVSLEEKTEATRSLLSIGADITEINTVRKHLSGLIGGQLARAAQPAEVHALILSDVLGDDLSTIASGPTAPDAGTFSDAVAVFKNRGVFENLPHTVRDHLMQGVRGEVQETPKAQDPCFQNVINAVVAGGETTVTLKGSGKGGRNQEFALALALAAEESPLSKPWVFLSGGTDGIDGPTDAGAVVDAGSLNRIRAAGIDPRHALENNDAYTALGASGDLLMTGATGTNVADLRTLLIGSPAEDRNP